MEQSRTSNHDANERQNPRRREPTGPSAAHRRDSARGRSYQGRFLSDAPSRPAPRKRRKRKQSKGPLMVMLLGGFFLILLVVSMILMIHSCVSGSPIAGSWTLDAMTSYEFYDGGEGALVVPRGSYTFTYTLEDDQLFIDFHDDKALDSQYTYQLEDDVLTLVGGNKDLRGTYVLNKKDS